MKSWMNCAAVWSAGLLAALCATVAADDKETPAGGLVLVDAKGKEQKLKTWEFTEGTRHLSWLVPVKDKEPEKKNGDAKSDDRRRRPPERGGPPPDGLAARSGSLLCRRDPGRGRASRRLQLPVGLEQREGGGPLGGRVGLAPWGSLT